MKNIVVLGATGSIGRSAADVIATHPDDFRAVALSVKSNARAGLEMAKSLGCRFLAVADAQAAAAIAAEAAAAGIEIASGPGAAEQAAATPQADIVLVALVGLSGLRPALAAIEAGHDVALATKEVLVAAGGLVMEAAKRRGVSMIPVDSEHSAVFQCIQERAAAAGFPRGVLPAPASITLTASGGPFLDSPADLSSVTPETALDHPRWKMGPKVTVDSATMMNKGFEILEARWLFDIPEKRIGVVVHPESTIHSLVTFEDGSTLAQLAPPDMRIPIQYALSWPRRLPAERGKLDLPSIGTMHFRKADEDRFPCLRLVREAARRGGTATAVLSAADETAVEAFLARRLPFTGIPQAVAAALDAVAPVPCGSLADVLAADAEARRFTSSWIAAHA